MTPLFQFRRWKYFRDSESRLSSGLLLPWYHGLRTTFHLSPSEPQRVTGPDKSPPSTHHHHQILGMAASDTVDPILQEKIEEEDVKEAGSSSLEATEWHTLDNHRQTLSFSDVHPVDIAVRNLQVEASVATSFFDTLKTKCTKPKVGDVEGGTVRRKRILNDVSADFPAGTLTAIIGGSGSGKVHLHALH